jgi:hypothetical protein
VKSHWNTDEFAEQVIAPKAHSHENECEECGGEIEEFRREMAGFRDELQVAAERPAFFWAAQRTAIRERLTAATKWNGVRFALASAVALFAVATSLMLPAPKPQSMVASTAHAPVVQDDEAVMRQVDEALLSNVPDSLEPANLIANEMGTAFSRAEQNSKK